MAISGGETGGAHEPSEDNEVLKGAPLGKVRLWNEQLNVEDRETQGGKAKGKVRKRDHRLKRARQNGLGTTGHGGFVWDPT